MYALLLFMTLVRLIESLNTLKNMHFFYLAASIYYNLFLNTVLFSPYLCKMFCYAIKHRYFQRLNLFLLFMPGVICSEDNLSEYVTPR